MCASLREALRRKDVKKGLKEYYLGKKETAAAAAAAEGVCVLLRRQKKERQVGIAYRRGGVLEPVFILFFCLNVYLNRYIISYI